VEEFTGIREILYLVEFIKDDYQLASRSAQPQECIAYPPVKIVNRDLLGAVFAAPGSECRIQNRLLRGDCQDILQCFGPGASPGKADPAGPGPARCFLEDLVGQRRLPHARQAYQRSAATGFVEAPPQRCPFLLTADKPLIRRYGPVP